MSATDATLADVVGLLRELVAASRPQPTMMIDLRELAGLMKLGSSTVERLKATPEIGPQPVRIGGSLRWDRAEVVTWLRARNSRGELYDAATWPAVWKQLRDS